MEGKFVDYAKLVEQLVQLRNAIDWHKNRINLSLGPQVFFMRRVELPPMTGKEISRAMCLEVEKHFPITSGEAVFDFCPLSRYPKQEATPREYLLAAVPKKTADIYTSVAEEAGFKTIALEILPLSLLRSLFHKTLTGPDIISDQNNAYRVLLDVGFSGSSLLITRGENYHLYRALNIGIEHFYRAVAGANSANYEQAHRRVYAREPLDSSGLKATADQLASKITQSLSYWWEQSSLPEPEVQSFKICGGGAFIPGLAPYLARVLTVKPVLHNPLVLFTGTAYSQHPDRYREESFYTAAFGLALRGWVK